MGSRRIARERALQALYQLDMGGASNEAEALESAFAATADEATRDSAAADFARELVAGVRAHLEAIDRLIAEHSHNWRIERMSRVDRNVLRVAVFELQHRADIPKKVTLNEAIELGKTFGTEESAAFINGLLDRIAATVDKP